MFAAWRIVDDEYSLALVSSGWGSLALSLLLACFEQIVHSLLFCLVNVELWPLLAIRSLGKKKIWGSVPRSTFFVPLPGYAWGATEYWVVKV